MVPPIGQRLVESSALILVGFWLISSVGGWRWLSVGCGIVLGAAGFGLWWLTGFKGTWDWPV